MGVYWVSQTNRGEALLDFTRMVTSWWQFLNAPANRSVLVDGDELHHRMTVYTRHNFCRLARPEARFAISDVRVGCDYVARIGADRRGDVQPARVFDGGSFIATASANLPPKVSVLAIKRSARWQALLRRPLKSADNFPLRFHVAVHSRIVTPIDDPSADELFDGVRDYRSKVEAWVSSTLDSIVSTEWKYDRVVRYSDDLLGQLNRRWQREGRRELPVLSNHIETEFTGLITKPRREYEHTRNVMLDGEFARIEEQLRREESKKDRIEQLFNRASEGVTHVHSQMSKLDGREIRIPDRRNPDYAELHPTGKGSLADLVTRLREETVANRVRIPVGGTDFVRGVISLVTTPRADFDRETRQFVGRCEQLEAIIHEVVGERSRNLAKDAGGDR